MTTLIRQLKLHTLIGEKAPTDSRVGLIVAFFNEIFDGMEYSILPDHNKKNVIFHKGDTFYFEQNSKIGYLLCRWEGFWSFFRNDLSMEHRETQAIVKYMVEKHLKHQIGTSGPIRNGRAMRIEKHLNQQVGSPLPEFERHYATVEKHIKQQVGIPVDAVSVQIDQIEKHLKQQKAS